MWWTRAGSTELVRHKRWHKRWRWLRRWSRPPPHHRPLLRCGSCRLTSLGRKGTHLTSSRPWYSEWVAASAQNLASMMAAMAGSRMRTSLDICGEAGGAGESSGRARVSRRSGAAWRGGAGGGVLRASRQAGPTSIMMTARASVMRVTPPMKAPAPMSANAPGSIQAQGEGGRNTPGGALQRTGQCVVEAAGEPQVGRRHCRAVLLRRPLAHAPPRHLGSPLRPPYRAPRQRAA